MVVISEVYLHGSLASVVKRMIVQWITE